MSSLGDLKIEKISGLASDKEACGVFTKRISLTDGEVATIVALILVSNFKNDSAVILGDIFELVSKKLESIRTEAGSLGGEILSALSLGNLEIKEYLKENKVDVNWAACVFYKDACYIERQGDEAKVFVFEVGKSHEVTFNHGSGPVRDRQVFVVATTKFLDLYDTGVFAKDAEIDLEEIIDGLATEISSQEKQSEIAAAFVYVRGESKERGEISAVKVKEEKEQEAPNIAEAPGQSDDEETGILKEHEEGKEQQTQDGQGDFEKREKPVVASETANLDGFPSQNGDLAVEVRSDEVRKRTPSVWRRALKEISKMRHGEAGAIGRLRRNTVLVALVVLVLLGGSVGYTLWQKSASQKQVQLESHLQAARVKFNEADALISLNREKARNILIEAEKEINLALDIDRDNEDAKKIKEQISGKLKATEAQENIAFSTLSEVDEALVSLSSADRDLVAISQDKILLVAKDDGSKEEFEGPSGTQDGFYFSDNVFSLSGEKVFKVDLKSGKVEEIIGGVSGQDISVFFGNIYLLSHKNVTKYVPIEKGYSEGSDYLGEPLEFTADSRMAIDGFVWVTKSDKVFKFNRGEQEEFEVSGLSSINSKFGKIYTSSDLDNLYVVDRENSALLVISKEGVYLKAYQSGEFNRSSDLVVDEKQGKIYVAVGSKILVGSLESTSANQ